VNTVSKFIVPGLGDKVDFGIELGKDKYSKTGRTGVGEGRVEEGGREGRDNQG
jgi:hypothetical protein